MAESIIILGDCLLRLLEEGVITWSNLDDSTLEVLHDQFGLSDSSSESEEMESNEDVKVFPALLETVNLPATPDPRAEPVDLLEASSDERPNLVAERSHTVSSAFLRTTLHRYGTRRNIRLANEMGIMDLDSAFANAPVGDSSMDDSSEENEAQCNSGEDTQSTNENMLARPITPGTAPPPHTPESSFSNDEPLLATRISNSLGPRLTASHHDLGVAGIVSTNQEGRRQPVIGYSEISRTPTLVFRFDSGEPAGLFGLYYLRPVTQ